MALPVTAGAVDVVGTARESPGDCRPKSHQLCPGSGVIPSLVRQLYYLQPRDGLEGSSGFSKPDIGGGGGAADCLLLRLLLFGIRRLSKLRGIVRAGS